MAALVFAPPSHATERVVSLNLRTDQLLVLLAADMLPRAATLILPLNAEPPLGVLTALLGAPILVAARRRLAL